MSKNFSRASVNPTQIQLISINLIASCDCNVQYIFLIKTNLTSLNVDCTDENYVDSSTVPNVIINSGRSKVVLMSLFYNLPHKYSTILTLDQLHT